LARGYRCARPPPGSCPCRALFPRCQRPRRGASASQHADALPRVWARRPAPPARGRRPAISVQKQRVPQRRPPGELGGRPVCEGHRAGHPGPSAELAQRSAVVNLPGRPSLDGGQVRPATSSPARAQLGLRHCRAARPPRRARISPNGSMVWGNVSDFNTSWKFYSSVCGKVLGPGAPVLLRTGARPGKPFGRNHSVRRVARRDVAGTRWSRRWVT